MAPGSRHSQTRLRLFDARLTAGEALREISDPALCDLLGQSLALYQCLLGLGQQLPALDEVEQTQVIRDTAHQVVQNARVDDVGIDDGAWRRLCTTHSAGAPIASRSRDHWAVSSRWRSRCSSNASTEESGIFQ